MSDSLFEKFTNNFRFLRKKKPSMVFRKNVIILIQNGSHIENHHFVSCDFRSYKGLSMIDAWDAGLLVDVKFNGNLVDRSCSGVVGLLRRFG